MQSMILMFCLSGAASPVYGQQQISVVTTIRPLEFISAAIVGESGSSSIIGLNDSPHSFSLTPQTRLALEQADILLWIAPQFEIYLEELFADFKAEKTVITAAELPGLTRHEFADGQLDPHLWLDPNNGIRIATALAKELSSLYPDQQQRFASRLADFEAETSRRWTELQQEFTGYSDTSYLVYHEAYQYFESSVGISSRGALVHNPELEPGMREVLELRNLVNTSEPSCIILEPDSSAALVDTLVQDPAIPRVTIDLLGYDIASSATAYVDLINLVASGFKDCLSMEN